MQIPVRLSAGLAFTTGQTRFTLTLPEGAIISDAIGQIVTQQPGLAGPIQRALPMLRGQHVDKTSALREGEELLLLLPAAGG